jgi:hypothetical protein
MKHLRKHEPNANGDGRGHGSSRIGLAIALMASACALFGASAAQASTITVGSVLPPGFTSEPFKEKQTFLNTALPEKGANLVSPVSGAIVRWRMQGAKGGPFFLRVLHPNGTGAYAASGTSGAVTPTDPGLQTFTANLPVKAGDLIGIDPTNVTDEIGVVDVPGASFASIFPSPSDGATVPARPSATKFSRLRRLLRSRPAPAPSPAVPKSKSLAPTSPRPARSNSVRPPPPPTRSSPRPK